MVWRILLGILLTLVIVAAFAFPIVPAPSSLLEFPLIPGLEEKARIIFFHVPTAWLSVMAFFTGMFYGIRYLRKRDIRDDLRSSAAAGLGLLFCILATVTGMIWAKFNWGSFWNWDPRETSIFVLLLIYGAYFALRSAVEVEEKRATLSAVYSIIAAVTVPFFVFVSAVIVLVAPAAARGQLAGLYIASFTVLGQGVGPPLVGAITDFVFRDEARLGDSLAIVTVGGIIIAFAALQIALRFVRGAIADADAGGGGGGTPASDAL